MDAVLIPVKPLERAKLRLSPFLDDGDRRMLGEAMLGDVLAAVSPRWLTFVVSVDPLSHDGVVWVREAGTGLNDALATGTEAAIANGVERLLILPSDVPLASTAEVAELFAADVPVALVPSPDGGTNALLRTPPDVIPTRFGEDSFSSHLAEAERSGVRATRVDAPGLRLDIDDLEGLWTLANAAPGSESAALARRLVDSFSPG